MARATKRTSVMLGALAAVFVIIIVILCIVPKAGSPGHESLEGQAKSGESTDVLIDTSTASTTTTTTTTITTPAPPPPPTPPPTTTATTESTTTTATTPTTTRATTEKSTTTATTRIPLPPSTTASTDDSLASITTTESSPPTTTTNDTDYSTDYDHDTDDDSFSNDTTVHDSTTVTTLLSTADSTTVTTLPTTADSTTVTTLPTTADSTTVTTLPTTADSTTVTTLLSTDDSPNDTLSTTDDSPNDTPSTTDDYDGTITNTTETTVLSTTTEQPTTITTPTTPTATTLPAATTTSPEEDTKHCQTPACKTLAANMLATMDHTGNVNRCEDFYQYACGGLMQNPFLHARDPEVIARNLIKKELETTDPDGDSALGKMRIFYDSCLGAVDQDATQEWKAAMQEVFGQDCFNWTSPSAMKPLNLTLVLAKLMLHDFTPFFDVDLDVDYEVEDKFTVTLSPALPGSPFSDDLARRACLEDHHRRLEDLEGGKSIDLNKEYSDNFIECVRRGKGLEARIERMEEAVRTFGLLDDLEDSAEADTILKNTKTMTKTFLMDLSHVIPEVATVKEKLLNKNNLRFNIEDLDDKVINWKAFVGQLITTEDISLVKVLKYLGDEVDDILSVLQRHNNDSSTALSSVLMMLWSERLYTDFVKPLGSGVGEPDYCLQASVTLMQDAASKLYMNALSDDEMDARKTQITNIAASIKRAGLRELERKGRKEDEVQKLEDMLDNVMTTIVTDVYVEESVEQLNITSTNSFFDNCIRLLVNERRLRYDMYRPYPLDVPWKFMRPYDAFGVHVYALNRIMMPFAAQDEPSTFDTIPAYLSYAGIGHMISHLAMHGYDTSGLHFQAGGKKVVLNGHAYYTGRQKGLREQYNANNSFVIAASVGVNATVKMGTLALNELLADSGAARLAWEAYTMRNDLEIPEATPSQATHESEASRRRRRRRSLQDLPRRTRRVAPVPLPSIESEEKALPWLGLSPIQLYFLHWSQRYCSASGGMGLLELMESEQPPARMRVNLVLQNEPLFSQAFNCNPKSEQTPFVLG